MLIVGERINTSRPEIKKAVDSRDKGFILKEAKRQIDAGASILDVNCGTTMEKEPDNMLWLIKIIQADNNVRICIDSPDPGVLKEALSIHKGRALINSITADRSRYEKILPFCKDYDCDIIALTMDNTGMPDTAEDRIRLAENITRICSEYGVSRERLYIDPLVRPVSSEPKQACESLEALKLLKGSGFKTIAGLSNVSFGLPKRHLINRTFLSMAYFCGLDACIIDPLDKPLAAVIFASSAILGRDSCASYLGAFRSGVLG